MVAGKRKVEKEGSVMDPQDPFDHGKKYIGRSGGVWWPFERTGTPTTIDRDGKAAWMEWSNGLQVLRRNGLQALHPDGAKLFSDDGNLRYVSVVRN